MKLIFMSFLRDRSQVVVGIVGVVLLASNVFLIVQNLQLRRAVEQSRLFVTEEGFKFSELKIKTLDGNEETISFSDADPMTLFLIFSTSCSYCIQEYPHWKSLVENLDKDRWRVFALTLEDDLEKIGKHLDEHELKGVKAGSISKEDAQKARMRYTPMTVATDQHGEVKKVWPGLWTKAFELP